MGSLARQIARTKTKNILVTERAGKARRNTGKKPFMGKANHFTHKMDSPMTKPPGHKKKPVWRVTQIVNENVEIYKQRRSANNQAARRRRQKKYTTTPTMKNPIRRTRRKMRRESRRRNR